MLTCDSNCRGFIYYVHPVEVYGICLEDLVERLLRSDLEKVCHVKSFESLLWKIEGFSRGML
jgi:hypothetical protein